MKKKKRPDRNPLKKSLDPGLENKAKVIPSVPKKKVTPLKAETEAFHIVGMGASAGGLESFEQFFTLMPPDSGAAFVLVPHLDPTHMSMMTDLMSRFTKMPVLEVKDGTKVEPNHVYVIPPNTVMSIQHRTLRLSELKAPYGLRMPIDFFFRSLAEDQGERAICIILSGSGTDGTLGLRAINGAGGISVVQDPATAKYDGMPKSAISTGIVDYILPVNKMPEQLVAYVKYHPKKIKKVSTALEKSPEILQSIITIIKTRTGHDFSFYKKSTIYRRIEKRMKLHEIEDPSVYVRYLYEHPEEVKVLFKELLIVVTSFFRDPDAFEMLKKKILPKLLENKPESYCVRIWVPGCATGEEVYSIAIILKEFMEKHGREFDVQIFGTDLDDEAINIARAGLYQSNISLDVSAERLRRFFVKEDGTYRIKKEIREKVVFAVQNITRDPPFTKLDLLSCRNLLIYFDVEFQHKLLSIFHYSLKPGGILFLGPSESVGKFVNLFTSVDKKWKFYKSKESMASLHGVMYAEPPALKEPVVPGEEIKKAVRIDIDELAQKILLENFAPSSALINEKGDILYIHGRTGKYLEPSHGRASLNIFDMAREGLQYELRSAVHNAIVRKRDITYKDIQVKTNGKYQAINLIVKPVGGPEATQELLMVVFEDVEKVKEEKTKKEKGRPEKQLNKRVQSLERELKYTKERLKYTIEELQANVEELKSSNEELQSTNEEFQSTNEELETSKEELQSVNEELVTVNSELQSKIDQLSHAESDLKNLFDNIRVGTIYLDNSLCIKRFNAEVIRVINLIPTDIGRPISHIVSNLNYGGLVMDVQEVLDKLASKELEVQTKDKKWLLMQIMPYKTLENIIDGVVMTFTDITNMKQSEDRLAALNTNIQAARKYAEDIVETVREPLLILDGGLRVLSANWSFYKVFQVSKEDTVGKYVYELGNKQWDIPCLRRLLEHILPENTHFEDFRVEHDFPHVGRKKILLNARRIAHEGADTQMILLAFEDITIHKDAE